MCKQLFNHVCNSHFEIKVVIPSFHYNPKKLQNTSGTSTFLYCNKQFVDCECTSGWSTREGETTFSPLPIQSLSYNPCLKTWPDWQIPHRQKRLEELGYHGYAIVRLKLDSEKNVYSPSISSPNQ